MFLAAPWNNSQLPLYSMIGNAFTPSFLIRLMTRKKIPMKIGKKPVVLGKEQKEGVLFADYCRNYTITGELRAIWTHPANEGKRHPVVGLILKGMGMIPGFGDYIFVGTGGNGALEFKTDGKDIEGDQLDFKHWCDHEEVPHHVCYTAVEGIGKLVEWGIIKLNPNLNTYPVLTAKFSKQFNANLSGDKVHLEYKTMP